MKKSPIFAIVICLMIAACAPLGSSNTPTEASKVSEPAPLTETPGTQVVIEEVQKEQAGTSTNTGTPGEASAGASAGLTEEEIAAPPPGGKSLQPLLEQADIDIDQVKVLLPPDAIPAISPEKAAQIMVSVAEAEAAGIEPDVRVIGISINGESQAYPIPFLSRHEIINTEVGGELIAATW